MWLAVPDYINVLFNFLVIFFQKVAFNVKWNVLDKLLFNVLCSIFSLWQHCEGLYHMWFSPGNVLERFLVWLLRSCKKLCLICVVKINSCFFACLAPNPPQSSYNAWGSWWKSNGNIFCVSGHLCEEFTSHRWIPPHKCQWRGALMFSLFCARINGWVNNLEAGDLRCHHAHYDVTVMCLPPLGKIGKPLPEPILNEQFDPQKQT